MEQILKYLLLAITVFGIGIIIYVGYLINKWFDDNSDFFKGM